jgi:DUF1680 family protein
LNPDSAFIKKYEEIIRKAYGMKGALKPSDVTDIIIKMFQGEGSREILMSAVSKALHSVSESATIDRIWQVPGVFSISGMSESNIRNRALKDSGLRAEIESIGKNLANKILSGTLKVSDQQRKEFTRHLKLCRGCVRGQVRNVENKNFFIDLSTLIVNDAMRSNDFNDDEIFETICKMLTSFIIDDDDDVEITVDPYEQAADQGGLKYKPILSDI